MLSKFKNKNKEVIQNLETNFIVFVIGEKEFGVDVKQAREIIPTTELTVIPNSPDFLKGVLSLRGDIIPIIDLRKKLSLSGSSNNQNDKIIIVELDQNLIGMQVDDVREMMRISADKIAAPPRIVRGINSDYLSGVGKLEDRLLILLNLDKILSEEEIRKLDKMDIE